MRLLQSTRCVLGGLQFLQSTRCTGGSAAPPIYPGVLGVCGSSNLPGVLGCMWLRPVSTPVYWGAYGSVNYLPQCSGWGSAASLLSLPQCTGACKGPVPSSLDPYLLWGGGAGVCCSSVSGTPFCGNGVDPPTGYSLPRCLGVVASVQYLAQCFPPAAVPNQTHCFGRRLSVRFMVRPVWEMNSSFKSSPGSFFLSNGNKSCPEVDALPVAGRSTKFARAV